MILIKYAGFKKSGKKYYKTAVYQCPCGNEKILYVHNVNSGRSNSCGCMSKKNSGLKIGDVRFV